MKRVRSGSHLERIGDTWYYRRVVPLDARDVFGKRVSRVSLRTTSRAEATRLEKKHDVDFESQLREARATEPDGYPKTRDERIRYLSEKIFKENRRGPWDQELAKIPEADRIGVARAMRPVMFDYGYAGGVGFGSCDELQELATLLATEKPEISSEIRAALVDLLKNYHEKMSNPTIEWAYEQWLKAKHRPRQTQDEARRYIEDYKNPFTCVH